MSCNGGGSCPCNSGVERAFMAAVKGKEVEVTSVGRLPCIRVFTTSNGKVATHPAGEDRCDMSMISTLGRTKAWAHLLLLCHLPIAMKAMKVGSRLARLGLINRKKLRKRKTNNDRWLRTEQKRKKKHRISVMMFGKDNVTYSCKVRPVTSVS
jgi:hypothetical protein